MENSFVFKTDRPWPNPRLKRAAIVGHTTQDSVRLWFRTAAPGQYTVLIYPAPKDKSTDEIFAGFKRVPYSAISNLPVGVQTKDFVVEGYERDSTYVVDISGLEAQTEYAYALCGDEGGQFRVLLGQDRRYTFRTLPDASQPFSFGFYSCHMPYKQSIFGNTTPVNMEMWECLNEVLRRHSEKEELSYLVAGGDQVYVDGVDSLDIWKYLNKVMYRDGDTLYPSTEEMVSWYRDIYRGYWGFPSVRKVFSSYPTYMMWDDHELGDGWGSFKLNPADEDDELDEIFSKRAACGLSRADCFELLNRMRAAAVQVYSEYQHSHNPETVSGQFDYAVKHGPSATYFLDTRGYRDINRSENRILGTEQLERFLQWLSELDPEQTPYLFLVSTVPLMHMRSVLVNLADHPITDLLDLEDDLRDAWEHELHNQERRKLVDGLFGAAKKGIKVSVLSGDVHTSAVFRLVDKQSGAVIYQLTSSAITYNKPRLLGWLLGETVPDKGETMDGYEFERLALYTDSNFAMLRVDPAADEIIFQLYGMQKVQHPDGAEEDRPVTHSIMKQKLQF